MKIPKTPVTIIFIAVLGMVITANNGQNGYFEPF
jgi:hypothetical protein